LPKTILKNVAIGDILSGGSGHSFWLNNHLANFKEYMKSLEEKKADQWMILTNEKV
jgi:hypothetical protein